MSSVGVMAAGVKVENATKVGPYQGNLRKRRQSTDRGVVWEVEFRSL